MAAGLLALASVTPAVQPVKAEIGVTQSARQKEGVAKTPVSARQYVRQYAGGLDVISHNPGIPPHIYGTYHVRRGTHKRSNK